MVDFEKNIEKVSRYSRFFNRSINNVELLSYLREGSDQELNVDEFSFLKKQKISNEQTLFKELRLAREKLITKIIYQDLCNMINYHQVVKVMSEFADIAIQTVFNFYSKILDINKNDFYIFALGKLGGMELNVSSDIDLIFAFNNKNNTSEEYKLSCLNLAKKIIHALEHRSEHGFVFRVDMRLRPHGNEGSLVPTLNFLEDYYLNFGREWERYAWIKGRVVVGDVRVINETIKPFVFRKYLDFKTISEIRNLKKLIKKDLDKKNKGVDVKLGDGGIREIEFMTQAMQLIRGGKIPSIQINQTLRCLDALSEENLISNKDKNYLRDAYIFYRNIEHRIQYQDDKQTHIIPTGKDLENLAKSFGLSHKEFLKKLTQYQNDISKKFSMLFRESSGINQKEYSLKMEHRNILDNYLKSAKYSRLQPATQERFVVLAGILGDEIDSECHSDQIFIKVFDLLESIASRSNYIAFFYEYQDSFRKVINFASRSIWVIDFIKKHPILIDDLIINHNFTSTDYKKLTTKVLNDLNKEDDLGYQLDYIRDLKHKLIFQLAVSEINKIVSLQEVSDELTNIADFFINLTIEFIKSKNKNSRIFEHFSVIGYGKYGAKEMGYGSDLDIVFLYDDENAEFDKSEFIAIAKKLSTWLTSYTNSGVLYELDLTLRPNGNNGLLVSSFAAYEKYQTQEAWTWEHQALSKARFSYGKETLERKFNNIKVSVLKKIRDVSSLKKEIYEMREKMYANSNSQAIKMFDIKNDPGGLVDIEFLVQYFILGFANQFDELLENKGNLALLESLKNQALIDVNDFDILHMSYITFRKKTHEIALNNSNKFVTDEENLIKISKKVQSIFKKYLA
jgi:glutamate-ammonia-ligase adenylyltransferase